FPLLPPNPQPPYYLNQFNNQIPKYIINHHLPPPITGLTQCNAFTRHTSIHHPIQQHIFYIHNSTLFFHIKIISKTIPNPLNN
ncbi:sugar transferase, partial [Paenibacillus xylanexedens]|uniref:sugar transferase n=1 Tax=Paenibacillus xylanexedens TaxID=528191 RepID=UPI001642E6EF